MNLPLTLVNQEFQGWGPAIWVLPRESAVLKFEDLTSSKS